MVVGNKLFKKKAIFPVKNNFGQFLSFYWVLQISEISLFGSTSYFDNCFGNDKIIFLGHKKLIETNISKNSSFHDDKSFWPPFLRTIVCSKPQGTVYQGPQGKLTIIVRMLWSHFWNLRSQEKQTFQKIAVFTRMGRPEGTLYNNQQGIPIFIVQVIKFFL